MSKAYNRPDLCNYYCSHECPIGQQYVPEIKLKDLSQIVLEILAGLNSVEKCRERLIDITYDGEITEAEYSDFKLIQEKLSQISLTIDTLQLWVEKNLHK